MLDTSKDEMKKYLHIFSRLQRTAIERSPRGGKERRTSGDTAGAAFKTGDIVEEQLGGLP